MAGKDEYPHDGADEHLDGTRASARHAEASEFESGLDYGAFIDDEDDAVQEGTAGDGAPATVYAEDNTADESVTSEALDGSRTESHDHAGHRADPGTAATEAIERPGDADHTSPGEDGNQATQSIDRSELDAWAAGDAAASGDRSAAESRPAARARGEARGDVRGERPGAASEPVTATASPGPDHAESAESGPDTLWDSAPASGVGGVGAAGTAGAGIGAGTAVAAGAGQDDGRGYAGGATTAESEDRRRDLRDAEARAAARDEALEGPRSGPRVLQVLLALFFPIVVLIAAVRAVASPVFLWIEYHRPGFPGDGQGFTTEDRLTYGSAGLDYLFNAAPARYLSELQYQGGQLFAESEVSHMTDVKIVMLITMAVGVLLALLCVVFMVALARTAKGGIRRALFAGSLWMLVVLIAAAVLAVLGWEAFFAGFHSLFFADGTWTFQASDALIRLYPNQFWMDAGIGIAGLVLLTLLITLICTWPTRRRRHESRLAQTDLIRRRNDWYDAQGA